MKIYPEGLETLLQEPSKGSRTQIPESILSFISDFQKWHQLATGSHKLTREECLIFLLSKGRKDMNAILNLYKIQVKSKKKES